MISPGYTTSEFWISSLTTIAALAVSLGFVTPDQSSTLVTTISQVIGGVFALVSLYHYVKSRTELKVAAIGAAKAN